MMHEVYNTTIKIHFGGGKHSVRDAKELGAPVQILRQDRKRRELELIGSKYETSWYMPGTEVNAYYTPSTDEVFIAGGLLTEPFYHKDYPYEHNLAGLGFVIAREIGHSFGPKPQNDEATEYDKHDAGSREKPDVARKSSGKGTIGTICRLQGAQAINALVRVPTKLFHHMADVVPTPPTMAGRSASSSYWQITMALNSMSEFRAAFGCG